jgi:hypothetical protein
MIFGLFKVEPSDLVPGADYRAALAVIERQKMQLQEYRALGTPEEIKKVLDFAEDAIDKRAEAARSET